ncbi:MAG: type II toxin-antitoxin system Phd/YefM family antitoxin [Chloroflexota bacterium]
MVWQLQQAKQHFSDVVRRAMSDAPQIVSRHGAEVVVVLSMADYKRLNAPTMDFGEFLRQAPDLAELDIRRDAAFPPSVTL